MLVQTRLGGMSTKRSVSLGMSMPKGWLEVRSVYVKQVAQTWFGSLSMSTHVRMALGTKAPGMSRAVVSSPPAATDWQVDATIGIEGSNPRLRPNLVIYVGRIVQVMAGETSKPRLYCEFLKAPRMQSEGA